MQPYKNYEGGYNRTVQEFGGLNERIRCSENEFAYMENMSLREYPALTVRDERFTLDENTTERQILGVYYHGKYIKIVRELESTYEVRLYINGKRAGLELSDEADKRDKKIYGIGNYIIILPDGVYVNVSNPSEFGEIGSVLNNVEVTLTPCTLEGDAYTIKTTGITAPSSPQNGDAWIDTSGKTSVLRIWDENMKMWQSIAATYIKLKTEAVDVDFTKHFKAWDVVGILSLVYTQALGNLTDLNGVKFEDSVKEKLINQLKAFLSTSMDAIDVVEQKTILYKVEKSSVIVSGLIDKACKLNVTLFYKGFPTLNFMFEHNNRLWGCRNITSLFGEHLNEIIASKQGDFTNWFSYLGVSTDSYAVTVGAPGGFTGGISFAGCPIFFKEDCIIKVYGNTPSNFQVITTPCMGVEKGMSGSIVVANGVLFYKSPGCFCAYDGSMPVNISKKIKNVKYKAIQAGATDRQVYFACTEENGERYILVFDIETGTWTKESCGNIKYFVNDANVLNFVECDDEGNINAIKSINNDYDSSIIEDEEAYPVIENLFCWSCESGDIGLEEEDLKYIKKLQLRVRIYTGASLKVMISYDGGSFIQVGERVISPGVRTVSIPLSLGKCESFRYRIEGRGKVDIYSIKHEIKEGSDKR